MAVLGAATLIALLLAEGAVRLAAPQQLIQVRPDIWAPADSLGWVNRPDVRTTINTGERTVHLYTDAQGMRVGAAGRRDAPTRVLVIGDSFMEALQVEYEQSLSGLLEGGLTRALGRPVSVWDAGVDGWDPPQYLVRARQLMSRERFDALVVAIYLGNDVVARRVDYLRPRAPEVVHHLRVPRALRWSELVNAVLYPINDVLKRHSQLFILLKNRFQTLRQRAGLTADFFPSELRRGSAASSRWSLTAGICAEIADAARHHGASTLFLLIPSPLEVDTAALTGFMRGFHINAGDVDPDQPTRLMEAGLRARGLTTLAVLGEFRRVQHLGNPMYGTVDRHLTPHGHATLAGLTLPPLANLMGGGAMPDRKHRPRPTGPH